MGYTSNRRWVDIVSILEKEDLLLYHLLKLGICVQVNILLVNYLKLII